MSDSTHSIDRSGSTTADCRLAETGPTGAGDELTSSAGNQFDTGRSAMSAEEAVRSRIRKQAAVEGHSAANCLHNRTSPGTPSRLNRS
jgi:hypothetical protein